MNFKDGLLHIWQQKCHHAPAKITGTPDALRRLAQGITLAAGGVDVSVSLIDAEGGHFECLIEASDIERMGARTTPGLEHL